MTNQHIVHADLMPFRCTYCGKGFKHRRSLNRHSKLHTGEKKFKCLFCDSSFARSDHLKAHTRTHNNDKPFQCHICSCGYNSQAALKIHLSHSHSKPKFKCLNCCKEFESNDALDEHIHVYHKIQPTDKSKQCPYCSRVCLGREESLRYHINEEHGSITRKSNDCNDNSQITESLTDDRKICQTTDCDSTSLSTICPKTERHSPVLLSSPPPITATYRAAKPSHFNKLPPTLFNDNHYLSAAATFDNDSLSSKLLKSVSPSLNHHVLASQSLSEMSDTYCGLCNANFNTRENYLVHMRTHSQQIPSLNHRFPPPSNLRDDGFYHIVNDFSLTERTVMCEKCNRSFDNFQIYLQHYSAQHCLQLIKCLICYDLFETMQQFYNHIEQVHPSKTIESYKCRLCNAVYKQKSDFISHVKTVHYQRIKQQEQQHLFLENCSDCSRTFYNRAEYIEHIILLHGNNTNDKTQSYGQCPYCSNKIPIGLLDYHIGHVHNIIANKNENGTSNGHCSLTLNEQNTNNNKIHKSLINKPVVYSTSTRKSSITNCQQLTPSFNSITNFSCQICDLKFNNELLLNEHKRVEHIIRTSTPISMDNCTDSSATHSPTSSFKCFYCGNLFTSKTQLERHTRIHVSSNNLRCNICDRSFTTVEILSEHKLTHCKSTTTNICVYCNQIILNENDYKQHLYEHNSKSPLTISSLFDDSNSTTLTTIHCVICKQSLMNKHEINLHIHFHLAKLMTTLNYHQVSYICEQCQYSSNNNDNFIIELKKYRLICYRCLERNDNKTQESTISKSKVTNDYFEALKCLKCDNIEFDSLKTFQQHIETVHSDSFNNYEYYCMKCNKLFENFDVISRHMSTIHEKLSPSGFLTDTTTMIKINEQKHRCYLCSKNFHTTVKLQIHLIEHEYPNRDFLCTLCQQLMADSQHLYNHMIQHGERAKLYPCQQCDICFMFKAQLINHTFTHRDEHQQLSSLMKLSNDKIENTGVIHECGIKPKWNGHSTPMNKLYEKTVKNMDRQKIICENNIEQLSGSFDKKITQEKQNLSEEISNDQCKRCELIFQNKQEYWTHMFSVHCIDLYQTNSKSVIVA
ncbi:unnamed protein product [Didymodactylos carnosus]|uniref:C2H2-type domain-containing protein n=1 Tax=Didymodactylos carnosus TaxID=1234261 RepID=A0A8S2J6Z5_9BILA|nr:unnamed protein product [Didymodactylos carnosus]CAF3796001.1 unnamed protein product [Didymodactylos carnosus]